MTDNIGSPNSFNDNNTPPSSFKNDSEKKELETPGPLTLLNSVLSPKKEEISEPTPTLELRYNEPDSPANIEYDQSDPTKIKLISFPKLIEKLTSPKKYGNYF